jgi:hypothetical protein
MVVVESAPIDSNRNTALLFPMSTILETISPLYLPFDQCFALLRYYTTGWLEAYRRGRRRCPSPVTVILLLLLYRPINAAAYDNW